MNSTSVEYLDSIREDLNWPDNYKVAVEVLLNSINDWPDKVITLDEFQNSVQLFIGKKVTMNSIKQRLTTIDFSKESWQAESLEQLQDIFLQFNTTEIDLKEVINKLEDFVSKIKD
jgi:hypothetical protein